MKTLTSVIPSVVLCVGLTLSGCAANGTVTNGPIAGEAAVQSVDLHEAAIQQHQDKAAVLEQNIQEFEQRLDMPKNSYRGPEGFRRASWNKLIGTWREELKDVREHIVWHEEQVVLQRFPH